jgi:7-cyano-7-deazaguanine synthase
VLELLSKNSIQLPEKGPVVCIVSGGLDSICTAAYLTREKGYKIYMITFLYGQRAKRIEIKQSKYFARILNVREHHIIDINFMKELYGTTNSLTDTRQNLSQNFEHNIIVPIRNAIFITIAAAWALSINAKIVSYGAHTDDTRFYPDCRLEFIKSITDMLNLAEADNIGLGLRQKVTVWSPAVSGIDKSTLLSIGYKVLGDEIFHTWSCYSSGMKDKSTRNPLHCGKCESCINRKVAISKAGIKDKTHYAKED